MAWRASGGCVKSDALRPQRAEVRTEALHKSIIKPFVSPHCDHYRSTRILHEALLKNVREEVDFIRWNTTGPVQPAVE
ncbi:hypothetical protein [Mesorhizobium sp. WSM3626]|uniref:hypothetical protein n=1 Tax=Mesorhizobium sp. WSM3626 TaxID=1040987 RepID=UPI00047FE52A|nr:hypothetical protein [Mesorhizobium sp. WSM3626]